MCTTLPSSLLQPLASPSVLQWKTTGKPLNSIFPTDLLLNYSANTSAYSLLCSLLLYRVRKWRCDFEGACLRRGDREFCAGHVALSYWWTPTVSLFTHHLWFRAHRVKDHAEDYYKSVLSSLASLMPLCSSLFIFLFSIYCFSPIAVVFWISFFFCPQRLYSSSLVQADVSVVQGWGEANREEPPDQQQGEDTHPQECQSGRQWPVLLLRQERSRTRLQQQQFHS